MNTAAPAPLKKLYKDQEAAMNEIYSLLTTGTALSDNNRDALLQVVNDYDERAYRGAARCAYRALQLSLNGHAAVKKLNWNLLKDIEEKVATNSNPASQLLCYLHYMKTTAETLNGTSSRSFARLGSETDAVADALLKQVAASTGTYPTPTVHTLQKAKIESLRNRDLASELFAQALSSDQEFFKFYEIDRGINTYYSAQVVEKVEVEDCTVLTQDIAKRAAERPSSLQNPFVNLVWSVDPKFLRSHGSYWLNLAPYLLSQNIGLVFLVTGDAAETASAIEDSKKLLRELFEFRGIGKADTFVNGVVFVPVEVPAYVQNKITFYACARYYYAQAIVAGLNAPILIIDVDHTAKEDIKDFVERIQDADFSCMISSGVSSLFPWRRCMAGSVYVKNNAATRGILTDWMKYLRKGFEETVSWTLDQNAMSYVVERMKQNNVKFIDMAEVNKPFIQHPIRMLFERNNLLQ